MYRLLKLFSLAVITLAASLTLAAKDSKKENSIRDFLHPARIHNLTMSPDGQHAAGIAPIGEKGDSGIVIFDLNTMEVMRSFKLAGRDIRNVTWTTNEDIVFTLIKWGGIADGVYAVNINRKIINPLLSNDVAISIIDPIPEDSHAWIRIHGSRDSKLGLAKLQTTGTARIRDGVGDTVVAASNINHLISNRIPNPPGQVYSWAIDYDHEPRIVRRFYKEKLEYIHRYNDKEDWTTLPLDPELWNFQLFGADKDILYIAGYNGEQTKGLYSYNIQTGEIGDVLFRDDYYDFSDSVRYTIFRNQLVGFRYLRDKPAFVWLSPKMEGIQKLIDTTLSDTVNIIYDSSDDFSRHLVYSYSDTKTATYAMLDLRSKSLKEITNTTPWLNQENLAKTIVFHFDTPDGLKLEGYLTTPPGTEGPYPTICLVHGGPWARDSGGYHDETQFLASQGYAVLKINFRGSTGYGKAISNDYNYDFRKMHDDITQAVNVAVKYGIADPDRIAIMGASFGGYAALMGATFEPDLYKCAITNMGVFDWEEMIKSRKRQDSRYAHHKLVEKLGNPKDSNDRFSDISPIQHVDKIKIPIFVIHGKNDSNVSIKQSKMLQSELKKHSVTHDTYFVPGEGHNIFDLKKRVKTYEKIIAFLDKHMK